MKALCHLESNSYSSVCGDSSDEDCISMESAGRYALNNHGFRWHHRHAWQENPLPNPPDAACCSEFSFDSRSFSIFVQRLLHYLPLVAEFACYLDRCHFHMSVDHTRPIGDIHARQNTRALPKNNPLPTHRPKTSEPQLRLRRTKVLMSLGTLFVTAHYYYYPQRNRRPTSILLLLLLCFTSRSTLLTNRHPSQRIRLL